MSDSDTDTKRGPEAGPEPDAGSRPDPHELGEAEALARALESGTDPAPGSPAAAVLALRASRGGAAPLEPARKAAMVARAVAAARAARRRRTVRTFAVGLAAAAAVLLVLGRWGTGLSGGGGAHDAPHAAYGGPSDAVFLEPFPDDQPASARLDRLTAARAHDYFRALGAAGGAP